MSGLNRQWAIDKLQTFLDLTKKVQSTTHYGPGSSATSWKFQHPLAEMRAGAQIAETVLDRVIPGWRTAPWNTGSPSNFSRERHAATRAIAHLQFQDEMDANLGNSAPTLNAATLHPWVWGSIQGLWGSGHFREAIGVAAKAVNAHCQNKVNRRDLSEGRLFSDVFTSKPPAPGHPRLRLIDDDGGLTFKNRHDGAADFARGLYTAIRNPTAHELDETELAEHEALEQVAAFSILARWVDDGVVQTA